MKRYVAFLLCTVLLFSLMTAGLTVSVSAADGGVDFLRQSSFECVNASAQLQSGKLVITSKVADGEVGLVVKNPANVNVYPYWEGTVLSTVPFDIIFYDKTYKKWIYSSANFCYEFENNNGATNPLPAGRHSASFSITGAYTWNNGTLPQDASICSIIFVLRGAGTLTVEHCSMTDGGTYTAYPDAVYQQDNDRIYAIPLETTVDEFCANARLQFDTVKTTVTKAGNASAKYVGTGDTVTFNDGTKSHTYTAIVRGDFDANGEISTSDVRRLLKYCLDPESFDDTQIAAGDINSDHAINTKDVRQLLLSTLVTPTMHFTQEAAVGSETYLSETKYDAFLSASERGAMMAGLKEDLVPQGLAQSHKNGLTYMSAYSSSGGNSAILVYDAKGRFRAEYLLYTAGGSPCTSHLGGLAVTDTTLFVSYDGNSKYRVAAIPLTELTTDGTQTYTVKTIYEVPVATSFLSYYDGYLWMGNFYLPSSGYDLMRTINYTTTAGSEQYGCYIAGFDLSTRGNDRLTPAEGSTYPTPDVLMAAPQRVQGMAYDTATNTVILSQSWGRKNDSALAFYNVDLNKKADTSITLNGTAVPCFILTSSTKQVKAIPMAEGITLTGNGSLQVLFESGANKYSDGLHRTDYIWKYTY